MASVTVAVTVAVTVTAPLVVPLVFFRWHPLQGVVIQAPGLGAQHRG